MALTPPPMQRGDRAPNFVLPGPDGSRRILYELVTGRPAVVALVDAESVTAFLDRAGDIDDAGADLFLLAAAAPGDLPTDGDSTAKVLADGDGKVSRQLAAAVGGTPSALVLDGNQRVLETVEAPGGVADVVAAALEILEDLRSEAPPPRITGVAPVLIVPNVLDRAVCRRLINVWETEGNKEGTVAPIDKDGPDNVVDPAVKKRRDHVVENVELGRYLAHVLGRRLAPEILKAHHFDIKQFDRFIIACYDAARGDHFAAHRDNLGADTAHRDFAVSLNLNAEDHEGGELRFPEYGPHLYAPPTGAAVVFSCTMLHQALPVAAGRRFVLLTFANGEKTDEQQTRFRQLG